MNVTMKDSLASFGYLASDSLARAVELSLALSRPLLLEGPAGVGKTALAGAIASALGRDLIRLQCYEGIDAHQALYDWNYHLQWVDLTKGESENVFSSRYLIERPLLKALTAERGAVLLLDEIDRADESFEAMLLEYLGEGQITIPEYKTVQPIVSPVILLTSNRTRPLSDALRRRIFYHHMDFPTRDDEARIVRTHVPGAEDERVDFVVTRLRVFRNYPLIKLPGTAEAIDWTRALTELHAKKPWDESQIISSLGCVLKDEYDWNYVLARMPEWLCDL